MYAWMAPTRHALCLCLPVVQATVRRKVLEAAGDLMEACAGRPQQQAEVLRAAVGRLHDPDDAVRRAAVGAVCRLLQLHPGLARSTNTDGRGPVLSLAYQRLRDKKLSVRREAASQLAALLRAWIAAAEEDPAAAPEPRVMLSLPLVVCNCAVRDPELGAHVFDTVWRAGMFPAKMAPAAVARYWAQMWFQAGEDGAGDASVGLSLSPPFHACCPRPPSRPVRLVPCCRR
jgi:sister-chromatid-cohesion protein PDS5